MSWSETLVLILHHVMSLSTAESLRRTKVAHAAIECEAKASDNESQADKDRRSAELRRRIGQVNFWIPVTLLAYWLLVSAAFWHRLG